VFCHRQSVDAICALPAVSPEQRDTSSTFHHVAKPSSSFVSNVVRNKNHFWVTRRPSGGITTTGVRREDFRLFILRLFIAAIFPLKMAARGWVMLSPLTTGSEIGGLLLANGAKSPSWYDCMIIIIIERFQRKDDVKLHRTDVRLHLHTPAGSTPTPLHLSARYHQRCLLPPSERLHCGAVGGYD